MAASDFSILTASIVMSALMLNYGLQRWAQMRRRRQTARLQARIACTPAPPAEYDDFENARWNRN